MFWLSIAATYFHNRFIHSTLAKALVINTKSTFAFMKYDVVAIRKTACRHRTSRFVRCEMRSNQQKTRRWMLVWKREGPPLFHGDLLEFGASYREKFQCHKKLHRLMILPPYHYLMPCNSFSLHTIIQSI